MATRRSRSRRSTAKTRPAPHTRAIKAASKATKAAGNSRVAWIAGLAVGGLAVAGTALYFTTRKSGSPALPPGPGPGPSQATTASLIQGHRYTVSFTCPSSGSQPQITGITGVNLVSTTPSGNGGVIVFDYAGATGTFPINASGCSVTVTDNGVSPVPASGTGDLFSSLSPAQQQAVQVALYNYVAGNVTAGASICPTVLANLAQMTSQGITGAAALADPMTRGLAIACFQAGYNAANPNAALDTANNEGVLDAATYAALGA